jgi:purine-nucleoside phosphorylase
MHLVHPDCPSIVRFLKEKIPFTPEVGVVLGSGLGALADKVESPITIPFDEIPKFFRAQIPGHSGKLIAGTLGGRKVILFAGRVHRYEGHSYARVTLAVQVLAGLGAKAVVLSCSVGGLNPDFGVGDLMLVTDHINLQPGNPMYELVVDAQTNPFAKGPSPFVSMFNAWRADLYDALVPVAEKVGIPFHKGELVAMLGPIYETPAEARMLRNMGSDAVCMSTVPEAIVARYLGLDVAGLAQITNVYRDGVGGTTHLEVLEAGKKSAPAFAALMTEIVRKI